MAEKELTKDEIIAALQAKGQEVNPALTKPVLLEQLKKVTHVVEDDKVVTATPVSESTLLLQQILEKMGGIEERLVTVENGGKNPTGFKKGANEKDIEDAAKNKDKLNPRLVQIVEDMLGVDFGIELEQDPSRPGFLFTLLVPERLSPVRRSTRPVRDPESGEYQLDPVTVRLNPITGMKEGMPLEVEYWPADRRSIMVGSSESYDVISAHCNRVRANIVSYYEKLRQPLPEFRTRI